MISSSRNASPALGRTRGNVSPPARAETDRATPLRGDSPVTSRRPGALVSLLSVLDKSALRSFAIHRRTNRPRVVCHSPPRRVSRSVYCQFNLKVVQDSASQIPPQFKNHPPERRRQTPCASRNGAAPYTAAMSAQHTMALHTELQRPNPL